MRQRPSFEEVIERNIICYVEVSINELINLFQVFADLAQELIGIFNALWWQGIGIATESYAKQWQIRHEEIKKVINKCYKENSIIPQGKKAQLIKELYCISYRTCPFKHRLYLSLVRNNEANSSNSFIIYRYSDFLE